MKIAICSEFALEEGHSSWHPDAVVSVFSPAPGRRPPEFLGNSHFWLAFHDIEVEVARHRRGPTMPHISAFLEFVRDARCGRLLIHCRAGLSRSPALAIIAAMLEEENSPDLVCRSLMEAGRNFNQIAVS